ncbi:MAG: hypothetical protein HZA08_07665 [Nitrospirae bacterium]|nr:hypothetical protein [Nitrospirota bacterium]
MKITIKSRRNLTKKGGEKRMKYSKLIITFVAAGLALGTYISSQAAEDVRNSKHNLSANRNITALGETTGVNGGPDGHVKFSGTTEVCVFCHTPHGGRTDVAGNAAPIWNRASSVAVYDVYTSPNFDAAGSSPGNPKGVSVACLSCHDGTVAFDALVNLPGRGGYQGVDPVSNPDWTGSGTLVDTDDTFNAAAEPFPNVGTDLRNDHPISMEIPDTDPQFNQIRTNLDTGALGNGKVAFLSRSGDYTDIPDKRDRLRAYPTVTGKAYIECASCHNPHENSSTRFLRYPSTDASVLPLPSGVSAADLNLNRNMGSLLCLSCHQK